MLRNGTDGFTSPPPKEGGLMIFFFRPKIPMASAGCEHANLGTKGQHATSRPPKPLFSSVAFRSTYLRCDTTQISLEHVSEFSFVFKILIVWIPPYQLVRSCTNVNLDWLDYVMWHTHVPVEWSLIREMSVNSCEWHHCRRANRILLPQPLSD